MWNPTLGNNVVFNMMVTRNEKALTHKNTPQSTCIVHRLFFFSSSFLKGQQQQQQIKEKLRNELKKKNETKCCVECFLFQHVDVSKQCVTHGIGMFPAVINFFTKIKTNKHTNTHGKKVKTTMKHIQSQWQYINTHLTLLFLLLLLSTHTHTHTHIHTRTHQQNEPKLVFVLFHFFKMAYRSY